MLVDGKHPGQEAFVLRGFEAGRDHQSARESAISIVPGYSSEVYCVSMYVPTSRTDSSSH